MFRLAAPFLLTLGIAAAPSSVSAQDDCQKFTQEDGTTKILCKDRRGRYVEKKDGGNKKASRQDKYPPLKKAEVVYRGKLTLTKYRPSRPREALGGATKTGRPDENR